MTVHEYIIIYPPHSIKKTNKSLVYATNFPKIPQVDPRKKHLKTHHHVSSNNMYKFSIYRWFIPWISPICPFLYQYPQFGYGPGHIQAPGRRCCGGAGGIYRVRRPGDAGDAGDAGDRSGADHFGCFGAVQMYNSLVNWVLFRVIFYFPNGKSTIWGIYSEYVLFFGHPLSKSKSNKWFVNNMWTIWQYQLMVKHNLGMVMIYMNNEQWKITSLGISKLGSSLSYHSYRSETAVSPTAEGGSSKCSQMPLISSQFESHIIV